MSDDRFQTGKNARDPHEEAQGGESGQEEPESSQSSYKSRRSRRAAKQRGGVLELVVIAAVAFALVFGIVRPFIVEAFVIPSESMVPTLMVGDRVLANKFIYDFTDPEKGDVAVFESVEVEGQDLIKRVVGTPGDTVEVREGMLYVNGEPQNEPYIKKGGGISPPQQEFTVPKDSVFVMGDNRSNSRDSRFFGPVPEENLEGKAFVTFWPPSRLSTL
jgi:signal peptidase I